MISTRGRYLLRILVDLAHYGKSDFVPLKDIALRQEISLKYLEQLLPVLKKASIVIAAPGKGGGYKMLRNPVECTVREILELSERNFAPVSCMRDNSCARRDICSTLPMWRMFGELTAAFFENITIQDLANGNFENCRFQQAIKILQK